MTTPVPPPRHTSTSTGLASTATAQANDGQLVELSRLLARQAARAHFQHSVIEGEGHEEVDDDPCAAADRG